MIQIMHQLIKSNLTKALKDLDKLTLNVMTELNKSTPSMFFMMLTNIFEERFNVKF